MFFLPGKTLTTMMCAVRSTKTYTMGATPNNWSEKGHAGEGEAEAGLAKETRISGAEEVKKGEGVGGD